jgi:hypothetical protein
MYANPSPEVSERYFINPKRGPLAALPAQSSFDALMRRPMGVWTDDRESQAASA